MRNKDYKGDKKREKIMSRMGIDEDFLNSEDKHNKHNKQEYNGISIVGYSRNQTAQLSYRSRQSVSRFSSSIDLNREPE